MSPREEPSFAASLGYQPLEEESSSTLNKGEEYKTRESYRKKKAKCKRRDHRFKMETSKGDRRNSEEKEKQ